MPGSGADREPGDIDADWACWRNGSATFRACLPELAAIESDRGLRVIDDRELVCLDADGNPDFAALRKSAWPSAARTLSTRAGGDADDLRGGIGGWPAAATPLARPAAPERCTGGATGPSPCLGR